MPTAPEIVPSEGVSIALRLIARSGLDDFAPAPKVDVMPPTVDTIAQPLECRALGRSRTGAEIAMVAAPATDVPYASVASSPLADLLIRLLLAIGARDAATADTIETIAA